LLRLIGGVFLVLHGMVHLLYLAQSQRLFELQAGMTWPDGSWAFSRLLGDEATRGLASIACAVAAAGFIVSGVGVLARGAWWRPATLGSAAFSALLVALFWDGRWQQLANQGLIALLIDAAIIVAVLILL
jgi:hypothetical protein